MSWWKWVLGIGGGATAGVLIADALMDEQEVVLNYSSTIESNVANDPTFNDADRARIMGGGMPPPPGGSGDGPDPPDDDDDDMQGDDAEMDEDLKRRFEEEDRVAAELESYGISLPFRDTKPNGHRYMMGAEAAARMDEEDLPSREQEGLLEALDVMRLSSGDMNDLLSKASHLNCMAGNSKSLETGQYWQNSPGAYLMREYFSMAFQDGMRDFREKHEPHDLSGLKGVMKLINEGKKSWVDSDELLDATREVSDYVNRYLTTYIQSVIEDLRPHSEKSDRAGYAGHSEDRKRSKELMRSYGNLIQFICYLHGSRMRHGNDVMFIDLATYESAMDTARRLRKTMGD
jgi:hypothetical protein